MRLCLLRRLLASCCGLVGFQAGRSGWLWNGGLSLGIHDILWEHRPLIA